MDQLKSKGYQLYLATKYSDFITSLKRSKPSVSVGDLDRYIEFTKTFGMDGWFLFIFSIILYKYISNVSFIKISKI